jgi:signal transduction histidine kinase
VAILPHCEQDAAMELASLIRTFLGEKTISELVPGRILAVDDDEGNLVVLEEFLIDDYEIVTTTSPAEALELVRTSDFDMVISDQRMPGITGVELLREVRKLHPDTIRIIISAYSDAKAMLDAINVGEVYRFILKPWDPDQVETVVRKGLEYRLQRLVIQRLVDELHAKNLDLEEAMASLRATQDRLLQTAKLATVGQLTSSIVRELKNHVTGVKLLADAVEKADVPQEFAEFVELGVASAETLFELIGGLNSFANKDSWKLKRNNHNLNELVSTGLRVALLDERANQRTIEFMPAAEMASGILDGEKVRQVVVNLVLNALDATEVGSRIEVSTTSSGTGSVSFRVKDDGAGIPTELLNQLQGPFVTGREDGLGLGLQVCRRVVEAHGGTMDILSAPDEGTAVTVDLPTEPGLADESGS